MYFTWHDKVYYWTVLIYPNGVINVRTDDGVITNANIAVYNAALLLILRSHANLQITTSFAMFTYLFNYLTKLMDKIALEIYKKRERERRNRQRGADHQQEQPEQQRDEQQQQQQQQQPDQEHQYENNLFDNDNFGDSDDEDADADRVYDPEEQATNIQKIIDGMYLNSPMAVYDILGLQRVSIWPPVVKLVVHLPGEQQVTVPADMHFADIPEYLASHKDTTLLAYFKFNADEDNVPRLVTGEPFDGDRAAIRCACPHADETLPPHEQGLLTPNYKTFGARHRWDSSNGTWCTYQNNVQSTAYMQNGV